MQVEPKGHEKKGYPRRSWYTDACNMTCRIMASLWFALHPLLGRPLSLIPVFQVTLFSMELSHLCSVVGM